MNIATVILVYVICWWMVFIAALPIGVRQQNESDEGVTLGTVPSAPVKPYLKFKIIGASVVAGVLTVLYYFIATSGMVDLDPTR